jgi:Fungal family of unknown function (DUF1776)
MVQSALGSRLHLTGLILSSSLPYPTGPIETITPETWNDTIHQSILDPISLIQSFLPLVLPHPLSTTKLTTPASIPTFLQNHLSNPLHNPLTPPPLQRPPFNNPLCPLLPRPNPLPRTPHNPRSPTQPRHLRSHPFPSTNRTTRHHTRRRDRVLARSTSRVI